MTTNFDPIMTVAQVTMKPNVETPNVVVEDEDEESPNVVDEDEDEDEKSFCDELKNFPSTRDNFKIWMRLCIYGSVSFASCCCVFCGCFGSLDAPNTLMVRNKPKSPKVDKSIHANNKRMTNMFHWCMFGLFSAVYAPCTCFGVCCGCCCKLTPRECMDLTHTK